MDVHDVGWFNERDTVAGEPSQPLPARHFLIIPVPPSAGVVEGKSTRKRHEAEQGKGFPRQGIKQTPGWVV